MEPISEQISKESLITRLSARIYRWLLSLGPREYADDYARPTLQVFVQCCRDAQKSRGEWGVLALWPGMFSEVIVGMIAEHLHLQERQMQLIIRRSMIVTFSAFLLFLLSYGTLTRIADPRPPFDAVAAVHPEIHFAFTLLINGVDVAFLAIILGGLPILFMACKNALIEQRRNPLRLFLIKPGQILALAGIAVLFTVAFMLYSAAMSFVFKVPMLGTPSTVTLAPPTIFLILSVLSVIITVFVFLLLIGASSLSLAIARSEFSEKLLHFALVPMTVATIAMGVSLLGTVAWVSWIYVEAPAFARSGDGLGQGNLGWLVMAIVAMVMAVAGSSIALKQGIEARRLTVA